MQAAISPQVEFGSATAGSSTQTLAITDMKSFDLDAYFVIQDLYHSVGTLSVMTDATCRSFEDMSKWRYTTKDEMKHLGGTIFQMNNKFIELSVLAISKMVEDFFNNLSEYRKVPTKIWDTAFDGCRFAVETRRVRHLGNVIKHNNSIIDSTKGQSGAALVGQYGMEDDTPIHWIEIFRGPIDDVILKQIFMAHEFCQDVMIGYALPLAHQTIALEANMKDIMLNRYVRSIPGHPDQKESMALGAVPIIEH
jgi:hypothetical protein